MLWVEYADNRRKIAFEYSHEEHFIGLSTQDIEITVLVDYVGDNQRYDPIDCHYK